MMGPFPLSYIYDVLYLVYYKICIVYCQGKPQKPVTTFLKGWPNPSGLAAIGAYSILQI